ncbi:MAG: hypothetical protein FWG17_02950 [Desulfovibrionaceae bacterium]|nr:hypothetical protein [Desulfovibrionaceae bacterium]
MPNDEDKPESGFSSVPLETLFLAISERLPKGWTVTMSYVDDPEPTSLYKAVVLDLLRKMVKPEALKDSADDGRDS